MSWDLLQFQTRILLTWGASYPLSDTEAWRNLATASHTCYMHVNARSHVMYHLLQLPIVYLWSTKSRKFSRLNGLKVLSGRGEKDVWPLGAKFLLDVEENGLPDFTSRSSSLQGTTFRTPLKNFRYSMPIMNYLQRAYHAEYMTAQDLAYTEDAECQERTLNICSRMRLYSNFSLNLRAEGNPLIAQCGKWAFLIQNV